MDTEVYAGIDAIHGPLNYVLPDVSVAENCRESVQIYVKFVCNVLTYPKMSYSCNKFKIRQLTVRLK